MAVGATAAILPVASRYTALRRRPVGQEVFAGLCPFPDHADAVGAFRVYPKTGLYWCRGCGRHGDGRKLASELATVRHDGQTANGLSPERQSTHKALAYAARYYERQLSEGKSAGASQAREYLEGRGIKAETLAAFGVGYAPSRRRGAGFSGAAKRLGVETTDLDNAGLLNGSGGDRFGERIVFPIADSCGLTVGFGGRLLPGAPETFKDREGKEVPVPKYLNSRESVVFEKRTLLYGLDLALESIRESRAVIVAEGYTDVLMLHQRGFKNAVGTLGTAFSEAHLRQLSPFADTVYLAFDPDAGGKSAVERTHEVARESTGTGFAPLDVRVASLDEDPADWLLHHDAIEMRRVLAEAKPALVHLTERRAELVEDAHVRTAWRRLGAFARARLNSE
jgi:DNA primase